jgi:hypothetical protein
MNRTRNKAGWLSVQAALLCALATTPLVTQAKGNLIDDLFTVKKLEAQQASLEGESRGLKEGDLLYFARSPYRFKVLSVKGNQVKIALPERTDLAVGQNLMRNPTDGIKKAIDTEKRLKQALEE